LTKETADEAKVEIPDELEASSAKCVEYVQPPIESRTLRA
jgi:hypothetical protein